MKAGTVTLVSVQEIGRSGSKRTVEREWVPEAPVALEFNGLSYAVMMATPADLEDFARGFALTEGLAKRSEDVERIATVEVPKGFHRQGFASWPGCRAADRTRSNPRR